MFLWFPIVEREKIGPQGLNTCGACGTANLVEKNSSYLPDPLLWRRHPEYPHRPQPVQLEVPDAHEHDGGDVGHGGGGAAVVEVEAVEAGRER